jgi:YHS domain-containing protein
MNRLLVCVSVSLALHVSCKNEEEKMPKPNLDNVTEPDFTYIKVDMSKIRNTVDPFCEMKVMEDGIADTVTYKGKLMAFCSVPCKDSFLVQPEQLLAKAKMK